MPARRSRSVYYTMGSPDTNTCSNFGGPCGCLTGILWPPGMGKCSEAIFARAVLAVVTRDVDGVKSGRKLRYSNESAETHWDGFLFNIRCDGSPCIPYGFAEEFVRDLSDIDRYEYIKRIVSVMFKAWINDNPGKCGMAKAIMGVYDSLGEARPGSFDRTTEIVMRSYVANVE
ncbi:hypothetical protein BJX65DRAFT_315198 [Aspergillus insuetus]